MCKLCEKFAKVILTTLDIGAGTTDITLAQMELGRVKTLRTKGIHLAGWKSLGKDCDLKKLILRLASGRDKVLFLPKF